MTLAARLRALDADGRLDLPAIGGGATSERWRALVELARHDVSEARLAEAHVDARQILTEAGREVRPGCLYGVWASEHPRWTVTAVPHGEDGGYELQGSKAFCTGAGLLDRALVTAEVLRPGAAGSVLLFDVDLAALAPARIDTGGWVATALADTATAVVDLSGVMVDAAGAVGGEGWYLDRPGFWDGAVGPAACWAGAALGLVDHARAHPPGDAHGRAHLGALDALAWSLGATLDQAGREVDTRTAAGPTEARRLALTVRHLVDVASAEVQDRFARALGPRPLVTDPAVIERDHALSIYRRQSHAERDLETLGDLLIAGADGVDPAQR